MLTRPIAAPIAFAVSLAFLGTATSPAVASTAECAATAAQLRSAAATAEPAKARKAIANIRTGEALCAADNAFEAGRKFRVAATALGIDKDQLAAATSATPAN
ncbi:hypothetical protein [Glacieibacterium frigidum]|uniref:Uncharacterized protein n=1 Tax=Glacieibacterium frigidum TaxID=2593303 RepID=A0A552UI26_9SPHN|nr:hypothetical protein [Glacieibacterium frigidum]TRW17847.1 hypothetical protein FMM06_06885 [Glacieibacterium frigidum]